MRELTAESHLQWTMKNKGAKRKGDERMGGEVGAGNLAGTAGG